VARVCLIGSPLVVGWGVSADSGLTLGDALTATLNKNPRIERAQQQLEMQKGVLMAAGAPFDPRIATSGEGVQEGTSDTASSRDALARALTYRVSFQKQLRDGVLLAPTVSSMRTSLSSLPNDASNRTTVGLNVTVPLLKDRRGVLTAAPERAAEDGYEASRLTLQHATAETLFDTAVAYWNYLAAQKRVAAYASSEARAQQLVEDTRILVDASERAPADLVQMRGNGAAKRVTRMAAEQSLAEARQQLGLAMGAPAVDIAALPAASTDFPSSSTDRGCQAVDDLRATAAGQRADLAALHRRQRSADVLLEAARHDLRSRLDLLMGVGYTGLQPGAGYNRFLSSVYGNVPGVDFSFQFSHQMAAANVGAKGRLLQSLSIRDEQRIAEDDLRRHIAAAVDLACDSLNRSRLVRHESETAVSLLQTTVQSEIRKFQLGMATLFDVIQAQDGLTNAMLGDIAAEQGYAVAIATVRFQTATLVQMNAGTPTFDVSVLLSPP
jgi:outer membrane protein TolC